VGAFLVASAAAAVFTVALSSGHRPSESYVVANRTLAAGTVVSPGDTTLEAMSIPIGSRSSTFQQTSLLTGRSLVVPVQPGELIQATMLSPASSNPALRPVSVAVDPVSLAGLRAGDPVDVLGVPSAAIGGGSTSAPGEAGGSAPPTVDVVARGASLIAVDASGSPAVGSGTSALVILGVSDLTQVEAVVAASHSGTIALVRAEPSDGSGAGSGTGSATSAGGGTSAGRSSPAGSGPHPTSPHASPG